MGPVSMVARRIPQELVAREVRTVPYIILRSSADRGTWEGQKAPCKGRWKPARMYENVLGPSPPSSHLDKTKGHTLFSLQAYARVHFQLAASWAGVVKMIHFKIYTL
jgi:hypothetical protein